ncbi:MAG: hypothetical protein ACTSYJ_11370, partial [Candidatus Thorarchaeota archaeon]
MDGHNRILIFSITRKRFEAKCYMRHWRRTESMYVVNYNKRELKDVELAGSHKTTVRWLIGRQNGAKTYAMRIFEIGPGGIVPLHEHPEE